MQSFGETIRELRVAQGFNLVEIAGKIDISPACMNRIEKNKEKPLKPEIIKALAKVLAADPDVLLRLSSSIDPEISDFLNNQPEAMELLRFIKEAKFGAKQFKKLIAIAKTILKSIKSGEKHGTKHRH